jgi:hypothetical protein
MGRTFEFFRCRLKMFGTGSLDRMELSLSVRSAKTGNQSRHRRDRFLILPDWHFPNLASRILSLCQKRLPADWQAVFGHPLVLLETFVDPQRFQGTIYKAANWIYVGNTKGFRRTRQGYSTTAQSPKMVFVKPLKSNAQALLSRPILEPAYRTGGPKIMLSAQQMRSLPDFFKEIRDPRRAQGRRHRRSRLSDSHHERNRSSEQNLLYPKKIGTLPVSDQEVKRTNEIKTAIPLLDAIDIKGKDVTADALGRTPILSIATRLITAGSKSAQSGPQPNSTAI